MSGMWSWFGGGAAAKKDEPKKAIIALRAQLDMLQKREKHLQSQINEQEAIARKFVTTNKNAAKAALRRKKGHEQALEQSLAQIITLEQQINSIESANINMETLQAMERAGKAMKQIHGTLTPDKVDQAMENLREQNQLSEEIVGAITQGSLIDPQDEMDLEDELAALQQETLDEELIKSGSVPITDDVHKMPSVSSNPIKGKTPAAEEEDDEEAELRKLQAEMSM